MFNKSKIKALTFDTGGTILDWHSGFKKGFEDIKIKYNLNFSASEYANLMREKSLKIVTNQKKEALINFDAAHHIAVTELIDEKNISISEQDIKFLSYKIPTELKVWPDFLEPFNIIKKNYYCISFTLLSNRLVYKNSKTNHIYWDLILSCESLEVYKPDIEAYKKTARLLQLDTEDCLMVACHSFDLNAAKNAGFKTAFVKRYQEWGENTKINVDGKYDIVVNNFKELQEALGC